MADIEEQARRLLATEYARGGSGKRAARILEGIDLAPGVDYALRAIEAALASQAQVDQPEVWVSTDGPDAIWVFLNQATNVVGYSEVGPEHAREGERSVKYIRADLASQAQVAENQRLMKYAEAIREAWLFSDLSDEHGGLLRELYVSITGDAP